MREKPIIFSGSLVPIGPSVMLDPEVRPRLVACLSRARIELLSAVRILRIADPSIHLARQALNAVDAALTLLGVEP